MAGNTAAAAKKPAKRIKVQATRTGYYDLKRRRAGDVFVYELGADEEAKTRAQRKRDGEPENDGLPSWVERVAPSTPERITTGQEAINQKTDEARAQRSEQRSGGAAGDVEAI